MAISYPYHVPPTFSISRKKIPYCNLEYSGMKRDIFSDEKFHRVTRDAWNSTVWNKIISYMVVKFVLIRRFRKYDHERNHRSSGNFCFPRLSCKIRRDKIVQFAEKYRSLFLVGPRSFFLIEEEKIIFRSFLVEKKIVDWYNWQALSKLYKSVNQKIIKSSKAYVFTFNKTLLAISNIVIGRQLLVKTISTKDLSSVILLSCL